LCPICDAPLEGDTDNADENAMLNCTGPAAHAITHKDAMDKMAARIETEYAAKIETMFKGGAS
jgi:hypothetical protein